MRYAIGMDVGGTKIETVVASSAGKILYRSREPTGAIRKRPEIIGSMVTSIKNARDWAISRRKKLEGAGIGTPGFIRKDGTMSLINNIPAFEGENIIREMAKRSDLPVKIANDANCFALAEQRFGAAKGAATCIGVIWGTGIGSGIIIDGKILEGQRGAAGEFGHVTVDTNSSKPCINCGISGDIESFCSAPNLVEYYHLMGGKGTITSKDIMAGKNSIARQVREQALIRLSQGLAMLILIIDPEIIVLGGGISNADHYRKIDRFVQGFLPLSHRRSCKIVKHKIADSAGVLGAAALVM